MPYEIKMKFNDESIEDFVNQLNKSEELSEILYDSINVSSFVEYHNNNGLNVIEDAILELDSDYILECLGGDDFIKEHFVMTDENVSEYMSENYRFSTVYKYRNGETIDFICNAIECTPYELLENLIESDPEDSLNYIKEKYESSLTKTSPTLDESQLKEMKDKIRNEVIDEIISHFKEFNTNNDKVKDSLMSKIYQIFKKEE